MTNRLLFTAALVASTAISASAASAHHPGIGGIGGAGGIFTIGAGTLDQGQFAFSAFVDYLRLKQLSNPTLLANIGNDVHGCAAPVFSKACRRIRPTAPPSVTAATHRGLAM